MTTSLSELAEQVEKGSIPAWLRDAVAARREEILETVRRGQPFTLTGPEGQEITIAIKEKSVAA